MMLLNARCMFLVELGFCPECMPQTGLLDHMVILLFSIISEESKCSFPRWLHRSTPTNSRGEVSFLHLSALLSVDFIMMAILTAAGVAHCDFDFANSRVGEHLFMCFLAKYISFVKCLFRSSAWLPKVGCLLFVGFL